MRKNFRSDGTWIGDGFGTDYSSRGSNAFIFNEIKKALTTWAGIADLEYANVAPGGSPDLTIEFVQSLPEGFTGAAGGNFGNIYVVDGTDALGSVPEDAPPPGTSSDIGRSPYRSSARDGNGWLYYVLLHEIGHSLGFAHAWLDTWDYAYGSEANDNNIPQLANNCVAGAPCHFPYRKYAPDFAAMDYRGGNKEGRHPRGRLLTAYEEYYAHAMYGRPNWVPLIETKRIDQVLPETYVTNWDAASTVLDQYSYLNSGTGRETSASVSALLGAIRPVGTEDSTWKTLYLYYKPYELEFTLATSTTAPSGWSVYWGDPLGRVRVSSGEGYTQPIYRHRMTSDVGNSYRVTKSSTPPSGFVYELLLGYTRPDVGITTDSTPRLLDDGGYYQMVSVLSGKPVGTSQLASNGTRVVNGPTLRGQDPLWRFTGAGDGFYRVIDDESGRVLDNVGSSTADGVQMNVWDFAGVTEQEWTITATSTAGVYTLAIRQSGKCLHLPSSTLGVQLVQSTCNGSTNQQFRFIKKKQFFTQDGFYKVTARHSGKVLDVAGSSTADGATVEQWTWNGGSNQRWRVGAVLMAKHSQKVVAIPGDSTAEGANADQRTLTYAAGQQWQLVLNSASYYQLVNQNSQKCLAVQGSSTADGARLQQVTCSSTATNQQFDIQRVE